MIERATEGDLYEQLARQLLPEIASALGAASGGQRLRVTTLPVPVMERLCGELHGNAGYEARVLTNEAPDAPWRASSTKIIELRNTLPVPLLVFIPPDLRTAAEDSLDIATFTELSLRSVGDGVRGTLVGALGDDVRVPVERALKYLQLERVMHHGDEVIEYLLTVAKNGGSLEAGGLALYCFGLIPDPGALTVPEIEKRLSRNWNAASALEDAGTPLQTRIGRLKLEVNTIQRRLFVFLREQKPEARSWGRALALSTEWADLTFEKWRFAGDAEETSGVRIVVEGTGLPLQVPDEVSGAAQLPVLNLDDGKATIKVVFHSLPRPAEVPSWTHFRIQILATGEEGASVAWESNNYAKPQGKQRSVRRSIRAKELQALEDGSYYLKVDAYDGNGNLLTTSRALSSDDEDGRKENESEHFLVVHEKVDVEEPEARAVFMQSLCDAWASLAARALGSPDEDAPPALESLVGRWAEPMKAPARGEVHFRLDNTDAAGHTVVIPSLLRKVEADILSNPDHLGLYQLQLSVPKLADVEVKRRDHGLTRSLQMDEFLAARSAVFEAIVQQHCERGSGDGDADAERFGVVETVDLVGLEELVCTYVDSYLALMEQDPKQPGWALLAQLDCVELRWKPTAVDPGRALLLAPTHPVRMAWHLQHTRQLQRTVSVWRDQTEAADDFRELLSKYRSEVQPTHAPAVLFDGRGRGYVEQGPITSHWSLYLPDAGANGAVVDIAASRDRVRALLGLRGTSSTLPTVGSHDVAVRLFEYLQLHPYVEQLHINVFNPGDAGLIANALRELERDRKELGKGLSDQAPPLRYVIRLFAPKDGVDLTGDALESLLDPDRQVGEDDEFALASSNPLHPKLVFARNSIEDFLARPSDYTAHVSIMLEQFAVRARVGKVSGLRRGSFVAGLLQEPEIQADAWSGVFAWHKGLNPVASRVADEWERRLISALGAAQHVQARASLAGSADCEVAPLLAMQLDAHGQALLKQVHVASDWVFTVDRNLGLEFYDSPSAAKEAGYLLDFAPEYLQQDRLRLMLTTRSTYELEAIVRPAIESRGLKLPARGEVAALEALRSLSGRLALRFMSSSTQTAEVIGLLLARWLLEHTGGLAGRLVVPLDAHRGWFAKSKSKQRADLLLVSFDEKTRTVFGNVVEVKLREDLAASARTSLYRKMRDQSENTIETLRALFDQERFPKPRADRQLRAKELSTALAFYVRRAHRYGLVGKAEADAALDFVQHLDSGYRLELSMLGVVFERAASGAHVDEDEPGYVVHRFGLDAANRLVDAACARYERVGATTHSDSAITEEPASPTSPPPAPEEQGADFGSFRDAIDRGIPSIEEMVPESQRTRPPTQPGSRVVPPPAPPAAPDPRSAPAAPRPVNETSKTSGERSQGAPADPVAPGAGPGPQTGEDHPGTHPSAEDLGERVEGSAAPVESVDYPLVEAARKKSSISTSDGAPAVPYKSSHPDARADVVPDILVGSTEMTSQYGLLGKFGSATVGIDLNGCNTVSLFGVQGFGKSYTLGVISEMATKSVSGVNVLPAPLATVIFHYHKSDAYAPEYASAVLPNQKEREIDLLRREYGAEPAALEDVVLLSPEAKVEDRKREFPSIEVRPIAFSSGELGAESWKFLLGAYGNDSLYVRQMVQIMRKHRRGLTLDVFKQEIANAGLPASSRNLADMRVAFAEAYIDDEAKLGDLLRPGRTVIVDLRDEWIEKDEALGLFVVMLRIFAATKHLGRDFNKLVVFDEAHKYITESDLIGQVVETIREMRHQATSVVIASQDPLSVPRAVVELTSILLLHRMTSPQWLKHLKSAITALDGISEGHLAALKPGEALIWAQRSTDARFMQRPQKLTVRPRFTQHGGGTKTAVAGQTVR